MWFIIIALLAVVAVFFVTRRYYVPLLEKQSGELSALRQQNAQQQTDIKTIQHELKATQNTVQARDESIAALREKKACLETQITGLEKHIQLLEKEKAAEKKAHEETRHEKDNTIDTLKDEKATISNALTQVQEQLKQEQQKQQERDTWIAQQKEISENQFKTLSEKILEARQDSLQQSNQQNIQSLLNPLQNQLKDFKQRMNTIHDQTTQKQGALETQINTLRADSIKISEEANNLTRALKGSAQQLGAWGEQQLARTLEMSGLEQGKHYRRQAEFSDEGNKRKLDFLIQLPNNKQIIIDSKTSLAAYQEATTAIDDAKEVAIKQHVRAIKKHIDDLCAKAYHKLKGVNSPDFVLMFIPIESAYIVALQHDKTLFEYGYKKQIALVSHTTLAPILRTIQNLWSLDQGNKERDKMIQTAGNIYDSARCIAERLLTLGNSLNTVKNNYNEVVKATIGSKGIIKRAKNLKQFSKIGKTIPELEVRDLHFDTEGLKALPVLSTEESKVQSSTFPAAAEISSREGVLLEPDSEG